MVVKLISGIAALDAILSLLHFRLFIRMFLLYTRNNDRFKRLIICAKAKLDDYLTGLIDFATGLSPGSNSHSRGTVEMKCQ